MLDETDEWPTVCGDCFTDRLFFFGLRDEVWATIAEPREMLCFGCVERRLKRSLIPEDFRDWAFCDNERSIKRGKFIWVRDINIEMYNRWTSECC